MPQSIEKWKDQVASVIQDKAQNLSDADVELFCRRAVTQRYSQDRPQILVSDVVSVGTSDLPLPQGPDGEKYEDRFSVIQSVEYPIGSVPENELLENNWEVYRDPTGLKIRLKFTAPQAGDKVRVTWTARHTDDLQTVPDSDFYAVCDFAASMAFEALAAISTQTGDSTIQADVVNYRTKSQEYLGLAKAARKRYFNFMGIPDEGTGSAGAGAQQGPALAVGDMDNVSNTGLDRIIHGRMTR